MSRISESMGMSAAACLVIAAGARAESSNSGTSGYRDQDGFSERALFVLDREGKVFWSFLSPIDVNPGADGVLDALDGLDGEAPEDDAQQVPREQPARGGQQEGRP